ncbi:hypothetical protein ACWGI0_00210 [Streptomyces sp. NPDC054802]
MATGPEHYREAERLVAIVDEGHAVDTSLLVPELLAMAHVHATLALAAATAQSSSVDGDPDSGMPPADLTAWNAVCGTRPPAKGGAS